MPIEPPTQFVTFAMAYVAMLALPGPNFALVVRASMAAPRDLALATVTGIAAGAGCLAALVFVGASGLGGQGLWSALGEALFSGILLLSGIRALSRAFTREYVVPEEAIAPDRHFWLGFATSFANPITATFFAASALTLDDRLNPLAVALGAAGVFLIALCWFLAIGTLLSGTAMRRFYAAFHQPIEAVTGAFLIYVGVSAFFQFLSA